MTLGIATLAVLALLAQSSAWEGGLGRLPQVIVHLYDSGAPAGWIEIEADRDGTIREAETHIAVDALPEAVVAVARQQLPNGKVTGGEMELRPTGQAWEVQMTADGLDYEFVVTARGKVIEKEIEIAKGQWDKKLVDAAERAIPGGAVRSVERIERPGETLYHIKLSRGGASYKVELGAEGTVLRRVREAKAEIEIPLP
jgi:uncharacterized membrane protein YkoI